MTDSRAASRYVKSLLGLAVEQNAVEEVHRDMQMFAEAVSKNRQFRLLLQNPIIKHEKKRDILEKIFRSRVHPLTMAIFDIITRKNREPILEAIAREFHNAYNEHKGISRASVTTAAPLDPALRAQFEQMVKKISGRGHVELVEHVDKNMIGGFILNVADRQIDASIYNKIKSLKLEFSHNPYIKEF